MVVLLAEDEAAVRILAALVLEEDAFCVLQARNGNEALRIAQAHETIDLLLTDVEMGVGLTGIELGLRILAERPGLSVLVMSGFPDNESIAAKQGFPFLSKPFTPASLRQRVRDVLVSKFRLNPKQERYLIGPDRKDSAA